MDRDKIEVAWNGFSVLTESLAYAPAYSGEAFFVRVRDASSWGRTSSEDDQHKIEVGVCNTIFKIVDEVKGFGVWTGNALALAEQWCG